MAILGCQLDYIWNELQSRKGGHTWDLDLEAGRHRVLIWMLRPDDTPLIWATPSAGSPYKDNGRGKGLCSFFCLPLPCQNIHSSREEGEMGGRKERETHSISSVTLENSD